MWLKSWTAVLTLMAVGLTACGDGALTDDAPEGYRLTTSYSAEGAQISQYLGDGTVDEALRDFSAWVRDQGWTPMAEDMPEEVAGHTGMGFQKDDEILVLNAMGAPGSVTVLVIVTPDDGDEPEIATPEPAADAEEAAGVSAEDLPRYPGAVRTDVPDTGLTGMALYEAPGGTQEVFDFYRAELEAQGWTIHFAVEADDDPLTLMLEAARDGAGITLACSEHPARPGHTEVMIGGLDS